jgi:peptide/nickel transport system substrate-binding protein
MKKVSHKRVTRRDFLKLVSGSIALGGVSYLTGCGPSPTATPEEVAAPTQAPATEAPTVAPTPTQVPPTPTKALQVLRMAAGEADGPAGTTDPAYGTSDPDGARLSLLYDQLVWLDDGFAPQPMLAESWETNDSADVWTFKLRQGVKFHDGSDFTAKDVVYTFRRILDPETASPGRAVMTGIDSDGIEAVDDHTVRFKLASPIVELPSLISNRFVWIVKDGMTSEELRANGIGTGPFKVKEFVPGEEPSIWVKNENYWMEGLPLVDVIELRAIPEPAARVAALEAGQVDLVWDLPMSGIDRLQENPDINVVSVRTPFWMGFNIWIDEPPFDDNRVRLALKYSMDRQKMLDLILGTHGYVANDCPVASWVEYGIDEPPRPRDIEKAKELLADAGYADGLDIELVTSDVVTGLPALSTLLKEMAAEAGININIKMAPADNYWDEVWLKVPFCGTSWGGRAADAALSTMFLSESEWNDTHWFRPEWDELIFKARQTVDYEERKALYQQAQRMITDEGGDLIPFFVNALAATRSNVTGWMPGPSKPFKDFRRVQIA